MPTLDDVVRSQTALDHDDLAWVQAIVEDWQILADLAFADLVLWVPDAESKGVWAVAQIRPTTGATTMIDDVAGTFVPVAHASAFERVLTGRGAGPAGAGPDGTGPDGAGSPDVEVRLAPVRRAGRVLAVLEVRAARQPWRTTGALESTYRDCADALVAMIGRGTFPTPQARSELADSPRVGDGFVRLAADGSVLYASPNATSAYRRLGVGADLVGLDLAAVTADVVGRAPTDASSATLLRGKVPAEGEVTGEAAALLLRVIPLVGGARRPEGAIVLLRDVTELRRRERQLVSKEATIREIHHRVKNNLQTVAALLRLQARRVTAPEARDALEEAVRRVGSIALVHETLSRSFDETVAFDEIADRLLLTVLEVHGPQVRGERIGSFGALSGEVATPLAIVLTELIENAAQHAYGDAGGRLTVAVNRIRDRVRLRVGDDGAGLPSDFDAGQSLGLSIVTTLVESELGGTLSFASRPGHGTTVTIELGL